MSELPSPSRRQAQPAETASEEAPASQSVEVCASSEEPLAVAFVLEDAYEMRTETEARAYLRARPALREVLGQLPEQARRHFGDGVRLALEVCPDREGSGPPELYAHIVTALPVDDAWDRMLALEEDWWLDAAGEEPVTLHVEFA